jgi:UDP-N-acetylmuramate--alanine ligase
MSIVNCPKGVFNMTADRIEQFIGTGRRAHLVGIGGVSMRPLAEVLHGKGMVITGSDMNEGAHLDRLRDLGIPLSIGHTGANVGGAEVVIRTAAVHDDNLEIAFARRRGIPVLERAEVWGALMRHYRNALCVAGTHGKTTTTSMCTHIALAARIDPTVMIGGTLPVLGTGHRVGAGDTIILESCEYCNSFLSFFPTVALILNIEEDHLDFFRDLADIENSFLRFASLVPPHGMVVANAEDGNTMATLVGKIPRLLTFGVDTGDIRASRLTFRGGCGEFDVTDTRQGGGVVTHVVLRVPGRHSVQNALGAAAASLALGLSGTAIGEGLGEFRGVERRFTYKGTVKGAAVYDDYAHHPSELRALFEMANTLGYERILCAFQPHTYTRTKALLHDFASVLRMPDVTLLAEIYAAREQNDAGISSSDLAREIPGAAVAETLPELTQTLYDMARPGDLILTVGAGDIFTVGDALVRKDALDSGEWTVDSGQ